MRRWVSEGVVRIPGGSRVDVRAMDGDDDDEGDEEDERDEPKHLR